MNSIIVEQRNLISKKLVLKILTHKIFDTIIILF